MNTVQNLLISKITEYENLDVNCIRKEIVKFTIDTNFKYVVYSFSTCKKGMIQKALIFVIRKLTSAKLVDIVIHVLKWEANMKYSQK